MNNIILNGDETAEERVDLASLNADFLWQTGHLGGWLRWLRVERGFSIGLLAHQSGVAGSEIHKVENGMQECRIQSLLRICAVLGASPGWVLDRGMSSCAGAFLPKILNDSDFPALRERLKITSEDMAVSVASILTGACETAALLLRCSDPISRVKGVSFPHEEWFKRFSAFAAKIGSEGESVDRASILAGLHRHPVRELSNHGLLPETILTERVRDFGTKPGGRKQYDWMAHLLPFPRPLRVE